MVRNELDEQARWEAEQEMVCTIGSSCGHRQYPRVRGRDTTVRFPQHYKILDIKHTRRAAFRRGRELQGVAILVYPLPREKLVAQRPGRHYRKTVDWAVAVRVNGPHKNRRPHHR